MTNLDARTTDGGSAQAYAQCAMFTISHARRGICYQFCHCNVTIDGLYTPF
jgi:hypothetical protein